MLHPKAVEQERPRAARLNVRGAIRLLMIDGRCQNSRQMGIYMPGRVGQPLVQLADFGFHLDHDARPTLHHQRIDRGLGAACFGFYIL